MIHLPLTTFLISVLTFMALAYVAGVFVRLYDLLTEQNRRIAIACVFAMLFSCLESGTRTFCMVFGLPMPEYLGLLELGGSVFRLAWMVLTLLEMKDTLLIDLQVSQETWKKTEI